MSLFMHINIYKGSSINTIHSEVEAYIYMDIINYRLFDIFPISLYSRDHPNASYDSLLHSIYYAPSLDIQKFNILVNQFKSFSKENENGTYTNLNLKTSNTKYLLTHFYPLIP